MSSISNINQNTSVVNVGRTTPVTPGAQTADKSIPVVMASDQTSIPVVEQNKVQSEVALSLLGIPRAEIALGIFADVNTYDVNPSEWSMKPEYHIGGDGVKHLPTEAGALVEASRNKIAVLTSKRFFRYQPGRVSAATFGVKSSVSTADFAQNPTIRKFGIYDKYDGYYWESRNNGQEDNFSVVRRTQSLQYGPVSPYGLKDTTPIRGETNLKQATPSAITKLSNTQLDDYRIVGLGEKETETVVGTLANDRKLLTEYRYELIDYVLNKTTGGDAAANGYLAGYLHVDNSSFNTGAQTTRAVVDGGQNKSYTAGNGFYADLAAAYNAEIGYRENDTPANLLTAAQMEAKCKRDLDYWIDNFLLDLEYGGNAHTKWNTTNFGLSNGSNDWDATDVGVFPRPSVFEARIHANLLNAITRNQDVTGLVLSSGSASAGKERLVSLQTIVATSFGDAQNAGFDDVFDIVTPSNSDYGVRTSASERLETFMTVKRNFWSYYVTAKKAPQSSGNLVSGQTYTVLVVGDSADWSSVGGDSSAWVGHTFKADANAAIPSGGSVCQKIEYNVPTGGGTSSTGSGSLASFAGLSATEVQELIANKCQRDVGYVLDGYRNDLVGGGNAETTYNASMFIRGTGLSVYSQQDGSGASATLSEIARHTYLRDIMYNDLKTFGVANTIVASDNTGLFQGLANKIISNFSNENQNSITTGSKGFPGNLVVLRDGLIHTHAAVFDPSLLKDSKPVKAIVTGSATYDGTLAVFKLTEGIVTFGQHVKISWDGTATNLPVEAGTGEKIYNGEVLRIKRVIGPKGNEFSLVKEDATVSTSFTPVTLLTSTISAGTTGTIYIDTVVPFVFPKDYDISSSIANGNGGGTAFVSEIDTTTATLTNNASLYTVGTGAGSTNNIREFRSVPDNLDTKFVPRGGVFPLMYAKNDNLLDANLANDYIGFINTALNPGTGNNIDIIRSQIDNVNFFPEYVNWIKNNVKPEYWGVYEYRVPRSRFSHDALDGISSASVDKEFATKGKRGRVYSDIATGLTGTARPGENYVEVEGVPEYQNSLYDYDFTKVTMLKIEFSWYGAVGALFLAYVPVGNGEARWVRVHHLRASNQLKIASLGNATLPITYTTFGGGSQYCLGDGEDTSYLSDYNASGTEASHHIVKYGASYYIDGGDRGTVRLYSHNNDDTVSAKGKQFSVLNMPTLATGLVSTNITGETTNTADLDVTELYTVGALQTTGSHPTMSANGVLAGLTTGSEPAVGDFVEITGGSNELADGVYKVTVSGSGTITLGNRFTGAALTHNADASVDGTFTHKRLIDPTFYIGAKVKTDSILDQNVKVVWADVATGKVFLSQNVLQSHSNVSLLPDRSATVYGIETKKTILSTREQNAVRNRVQVYPTKLSTANLGSNTVRLRFKKTPIFQTQAVPDETLNSDDGFTLSADYEITNTNLALPVTSGAEAYISNGEETYGWFRGRIGSEGVTVFGRLYKEAGAYYFQVLESYEGTVTLISGGRFLADKKFQADGTPVAYDNSTSKTAYEKEGLSSVKIATNAVVPIADTGINVATLYLRSGTEQFDLDTYFDYNKEYLSFPLTDIADTLYFAVDSDSASTTADAISLGVTWEEQ